MKTWKIPVSWEMYGTKEIEADSLEEAIKIFDNDNEEYGLPNDGEYLDDSYKRDDFNSCKQLNEL